MTARYALYYAPPPDAALWTFGCAVIGYDAATGTAIPPLAPAGFGVEEWAALTAAPRRYGFHATLKAPFRLAEGVTEDDLIAAGKAFAKTQAAFVLPRFKVSPLEGFVALTPETTSDELNALGGAVVEAFEPFRAPLSNADRSRRLAAPLTERQQTALERWGYPYVFEDFRFHMTLTGALPADTAARAAEGLARLHAERVGDAKTPVDAVALFVEDSPGLPFRIVDRFVFAA